MAARFNITIHASHAEDDIDDQPIFFGLVNAWLVERGKFPLEGFWSHNERNTTAFVCSGCSQGFYAPDGFADFFRSLPWNEPEAAIAIVLPEDGPAIVIRATSEAQQP